MTSPHFIAVLSLATRIGSGACELPNSLQTTAQVNKLGDWTRHEIMSKEYHPESRDPTWNGDLNGWQTYVRKVRLQYEQTPSHKRKLLGPRLALRLTDKAWDITQSINHDELRRPNGAKYLLLFLRERLGRTPVPDAGQRLEELFLRLRRAPGSSMATWASQVREAYRGVQRALARARGPEEKEPSVRAGSRAGSVKAASEPSPQRGSASSEPHREPPSPVRGGFATPTRVAPTVEEFLETEEQEGGDDQPEEQDPWAGYDGADAWWWNYNSWSWEDWSPQRWKKSHDSGSDDDEGFTDLLGWADLEVDDKEILPSEVLGWLLLRRSGLPAASRLSVQSSVGNSLKFEDLERALRDQEEELLVAEANRGPRQQHPRRTFWVEEDGAWGLINEEVDEDVFTPSADSILWAAQSPEVGSASAFQMEDAGEDSVWYDGTYEWSYHTDGEWYAPLDDGSYVAYSEFKPWLDIEEVSYHDSALAKELADSYAVITEKVRTFQEAKHALHQKGKTRGYFKPKGKGKNFRKGFQKGKPGVLAAFPFQTKSSSVGSSGGSSIVNTPGYKGCFICGDKTHEFRRCPKRQEQKGMSGKGGKAVYMVTECTSQPAGSSNAVSSQIETKVDDSVLHDHGGDAELERCILAAVEATEGMDRLRFAVLDTGATETVGSMDALDRILSVRQERFGEEEVYIEPSQNKEFKFGNGQTRTAASFVHVPQTIGNQKTTLGVYALDVPQIPVLLGIKTLKRLGAIIDVDSETLEFKKRFPGMQVQLICGQNGHLLLDLCSNWDVRKRHNPYPLSLHQPESFPPHITEKGSAADVAEALSDDDSKDHGTKDQDRSHEISREVSQHDIECEAFTKDSKEISEPNASLAQVFCPTKESDSKDSGCSLSSPSNGRQDHGSREGPGCSFSGGPHEGEGGEQGESQGGIQEGGHSFGLCPNCGSGPTGPTVGGSPVPWPPRPRASRTWEPIRFKCMGQMGDMQSMPIALGIHSSGRSARTSSFTGPIAPRRSGHDKGEGREFGARRPDNPEDCSVRGGTFLAGSIGGCPEAEGSSGAQGICGHATRGIKEDNQERSCPSLRSPREEQSFHAIGGIVGGSLKEHMDSRDLSDAFVKTLDSETQCFLQQSLEQHEEDVVEVLASFPSNRVDLVEVCCGPNSLLTQVVVEMGGTAERIGLHNGYDMSTPKGLDKARQLIGKLRPRWLWFSLPCGPTSNIQNLNENTPEKLARSLKRKQKSRRTCRNCAQLGKEQILRGDQLGWEWPLGNQAWNFQEIREFLSFLEAYGCYFPARLDGCMVGVVAPDNGESMKKPWRIVSSCKQMAMKLDIKCDGSHSHVECLGHSRAAHSAFYPRKMCRIISKVVLGLHFPGSPKDARVFAVDEEPSKSDLEGISPEELKYMKQAIHNLHVRSGHPSNQALVSCLRARGVSKVVLALAKEHTCDSCHEVRLPKPHMSVSLHKAEILWHTLQIDHGEIHVGDVVVHVLFMVDEASHYMNVHEMFRRKQKDSRNSTTEEIIRALEVSWVQYHGFPSVLKCDPEGAFRGHDFGLWGQERGIDIQPCAAEDHGAIGDVESLIGKIKNNVRVYLRDNVMDPFSGVLHMVAAHNCLDRVGGFAPCQWAYGRFPTFDGRLFEGGCDLPVSSSEATHDTSMRTYLQNRVKAEEIYRRSQAAVRISRAVSSAPRKLETFLPGDAVYYKRYKTPAQALSHSGLDTTGKPTLSRWYGPARVLAVETRRTEDERHVAFRPGHIVWLVAAGRLKRCSPHQLRHCSERERLLLEASGGYMTFPWSFNDMIQKVGSGSYDNYDDLEAELHTGVKDLKESSIVPKSERTRSRSRTTGGRRLLGVDATEKSEARSSREVGQRSEVKEKEPRKDQKPSQETTKSVTRPQKSPQEEAAPERESKRVKESAVSEPSSQSSVRSPVDLKRYVADESYEPEGLAKVSKVSHRPDRLASPSTGRSGRSHGRGSELATHPPFVRAQERLGEGEGQAMTVEDIVAEEDLVFMTLEIPLPDRPKDVKQFARDSTSWMTAQIKKSPEVKISKLSPEEVKKFDAAKSVEVNNWIREGACRAAEGYVPLSRIMRMRWVLTYKQSGASKARIVILGFEDPDLLQMRTASPTMTRRTRQLLLTFASCMQWPLLKGDVKSAFLQGAASEELRDVYAKPVPELAKSMGLADGQPVKLVKACYGLANAPAEWHRSVTTAMQEAGFQVLTTEPCAWRLMGTDQDGNPTVLGLAAAHVDDFLFCGNEEDCRYRAALHYLYDKFIWSPWEANRFDHCGVQLHQNTDGSFLLDHSQFCEKLEQVEIVKDGRKEGDAAHEGEKSQLRGLLGGIQWRTYQTGPLHAAQLSFLQSEMSQATVKTLRDANKLCREVHHHRHLPIRITPLNVKNPSEVTFVTWCDAALGNRPNGGSTGGYVVTATEPAIAQGQPSVLNLISWKSGRLPRVARSSLAAEVQSFSEAEEEQMFCRLQWAEFCGSNIPLRNPEDVVKTVAGYMVTDARSLFDVLLKGEQATSGLGLREKYSALEIMSIQQRLQMCGTHTRWVHSEAQLADALTKRLVTSSLKKVLAQNVWTLVEDPTFTSSKRLKQQNLL